MCLYKQGPWAGNQKLVSLNPRRCALDEDAQTQITPEGLNL